VSLAREARRLRGMAREVQGIWDLVEVVVEGILTVVEYHVELYWLEKEELVVTR